MSREEMIEELKIELAQTKEIKDYEYWSQLTDEERVEVVLYRTSLVKLVNELSAVSGEVEAVDEDRAAAPMASYPFKRPKRPSVFDRYM